MNIPNIPTDNLYKFLSISGLLIIILSIAAPEYAQIVLKERIIEVERESDIFKQLKKHNDKDISEISAKSKSNLSESKLLITRLNKLIVKSEGLERQVDSIGTQPGDSKIRKQLKKEYEKVLEERLKIKKKIKENGEELDLVEKASRANEVLAIKINSKSKLNTFYYEKLIKLFYISIIGLFAGLSMSYFGFINWYKKIQLPLESNES